jgi:transposase, IS5 family
VPVFGYKNHVGIDRRHGFVRSFVVTDAASHDGRQLGRLLDRKNTASPVWADTAYRSAANAALMPPHIARGNASRARVRVAVEHVFAAQKCRFGLVIRSVGLAQATARLGLVNLVTNMTRLAWFASRPAPA